ncbi:hypothetical protein JS609_02801 [Bacillus subtilis]|uniref:hypothetical protein n=1 Tax=Bacillus subtilis TaxID=1423 RepID=UPI00059BB029|nr:hypothetical protein [Bacillus subtilis]KIN49128.1 hypothetical protein B4073_4276 [Bacillus subtilis]UBZ19686.1 hypothetical protein JS609_02801 [Bacillus subtilis]WCL64282.1 hypothetical protein PNF29_07145 [Bacillus subtilis]
MTFFEVEYTSDDYYDCYPHKVGIYPTFEKAMEKAIALSNGENPPAEIDIWQWELAKNEYNTTRNWHKNRHEDDFKEVAK